MCLIGERLLPCYITSSRSHKHENSLGFIIVSIVLLLLPAEAFSQAEEVFWADTRGIHRMDLEDTIPETIIEVVTHSPLGVAVDSSNNKIYWTNSVVGKVMRANLDGSELESVVTGGIFDPYDIELDVQGGKMYWTSQSAGSIQRANLDGSDVENLVVDVLNNPRDIALDIPSGKMYWAEKTAIRRANLDGSVIEDLVVDGLSDAYGVALDLQAEKMYWTNSFDLLERTGQSKIQRSNLDGSEVEDLLVQETFVLGLPLSITLDIEGGKMYWIDDNNIRRADLNGSNQEDVIMSTFTFPELDRPMGIELDIQAGKIYWVDNVSHQVQRANLDGSDIEDLVDPTVVTPVSIDVDQAEGKIYWVDPAAMRVRRANLDGSDIESLTYYKYSDYLILHGLALGKSQERVFLSGSLIGYLNLGNANIENLISTHPGFAFEIALDETQGKIYWVRQNAIERANLDGSDIETLVITGMDSLFQIKNDSIVLDTLARKLYWTDTENNKIQRANFDGSEVEDILAVMDPQAIALDVSSEKIYWISLTGQNGVMYRANLDGSDVNPIILSGISAPYDMTLLSSVVSSSTEELPIHLNSSVVESAYPNPFNAQTSIEYTLEAATHVQVRVYDVLGRLVAELISGLHASGRHRVTWDGRDGQGVDVAAGVYIVQVVQERGDEKVQTILKVD